MEASRLRRRRQRQDGLESAGETSEELDYWGEIGVQRALIEKQKVGEAHCELGYRGQGWRVVETRSGGNVVAREGSRQSLSRERLDLGTA